MVSEKPIDLIVVVGPTAVGKSPVAIKLAQEFSGEIINCDSLQLTCGLEIGTAKPSRAQRLQVPHHLYEVLMPGESINAAQYAKRAHQTIAKLHARGRLPIVVGGTGLYLRALLEGLSPIGAIDPQIRLKIAEQERVEGLPTLYQELQRVDPDTAQRLHPNDALRIRRALEIHATTGKSQSAWTALVAPKQKPDYRVLKLGLKLDRLRLYERINQRVEAMFAQGLLDEVQLFPAGKAKGIGYREAWQVVQGTLPLYEAIELVAKQTRHYAKRQYTWFKKEPEIRWFDVSESAFWQNVRQTTQAFLEKGDAKLPRI